MRTLLTALVCATIIGCLGMTRADAQTALMRVSGGPAATGQADKGPATEEPAEGLLGLGVPVDDAELGREAAPLLDGVTGPLSAPNSSSEDARQPLGSMKPKRSASGIPYPDVTSRAVSPSPPAPSVPFSGPIFRIVTPQDNPGLSSPPPQ